MSASRILVVEDNPTTRKVVRIALEADGLSVIEAADAASALAAASNGLPDLILQDIVLPDLNGFELVHRLRALPDGTEVPIIAMTGLLPRKEEARLSSGVFNEILVKPVEPSRLVQTVRDYLPMQVVAEHRRGGGKHVLLVDDDPVQSKLMRLHLTDCGFRVSTAADGIEAFTTAQALKPDAILSDVLMPRSDGFTLCTSVRKDAQLAKIPVVLMSAYYVEEADKDLASEAGADELLDRGSQAPAIVDVLIDCLQRDRPPRCAGSDAKLREAHRLRLICQLERQVRTNAGLTQRCALQGAALTIVRGLSETLGRKFQVTGALEETLYTLLDIAGGCSGAIYLKDAAGALQLAVEVGCGTRASDCWGHPALLQKGLAANEFLEFSNEAEYREVLAALGSTIAILVPLIAHGSPLGVLLLAFHHRDGSEADRIELARMIAIQIGQAAAFSDAVARHRHLEEQLLQAQKLEALGKLTGGIAHDFNNILAVIVANSGFLVDSLDEGDPRRAEAEEIRSAGERGASLTRQLLAFSRRQVLEPMIVDLNRIVRDLEKMLRRLISKDIEFAISTDARLGSVKVDPGQIEQVIMNLVVNARDAMPMGGKLSITTSNVEIDEPYCASHVPIIPGRYVLLTVTDSGCGMDAETQRRAFEPFFTTKELGKGTGLGLSTAYGIVKQSDGFIWIYSELGHGTVFKVYLPRIDDLPESRAVKQAETAVRKGTETILLVEDDAVLRTVMHRILSDHGYRVLTARDGKDAFAICAEYEGAIQLLLSDVVMPGSTGPEIAHRICSSSAGAKALLMSGHPEHAVLGDVTHPVRAGFIQKPFTASALARKVRETLDGPTDQNSQ